MRARCASNVSDSLLTDTQLNAYVNQGLARMTVEETDWPWQKVIDSAQSLTINTSSFTPPSGWYRTSSLTHLDTGVPLERRAPKYLDRVIGQGRPELWAPDGAIITFKCTANQTYTVVHRYFRVEPTLVADADVPLVPEVYSQAVVEWAAYQAMRQGNRQQQADAALVDFRASIKTLQKHVNQSGEPLRITQRPGGWL